MLPPVELLFVSNNKEAAAPVFAGVTASADTVSLSSDILSSITD
jgi:hypothetical protein